MSYINKIVIYINKKVKSIYSHLFTIHQLLREQQIQLTTTNKGSKYG